MNLTQKKLVAAAAFLVAGASAAAAYPATVTANLNVRSGPGTGYAVIDNLPAGSVVDIAGCTGNWCEISGTGWASASYLATGGAPQVGYVVPSAPAVSFYIGSVPYYWDDGGYYWHYRDGRRNRISRDFFDDRRDIRWRSDRDRRRWENWREVRRDDRRDWQRDRRDNRRDGRDNRRDQRQDRADNSRERQIRDRVRSMQGNDAQIIRRGDNAGALSRSGARGGQRD